MAQAGRTREPSNERECGQEQEIKMVKLGSDDEEDKDQRGRGCSRCGVYEAFQFMSMECCTLEYRTLCSFKPEGPATCEIMPPSGWLKEWDPTQTAFVDIWRHMKKTRTEMEAHIRHIEVCMRAREEGFRRAREEAYSSMEGERGTWRWREENWGWSYWREGSWQEESWYASPSGQVEW